MPTSLELEKLAILQKYLEDMENMRITREAEQAEREVIENAKRAVEQAEREAIEATRRAEQEAQRLAEEQARLEAESKVE